MRMKFYSFFLLSAMTITQLHCQNQEIEYFITANANLHFPFGDSERGAYPVLGYDKKSNPKLQIGGLGAGFTAIKDYRKNALLKAQVNISRHVYWDELSDLRSTSNQLLGSFSTSSIDYTTGVTGTIHYLLTKKLSIGTGLGYQVMLLSFTKLNVEPFSEDQDPVQNHFYKRFMPMLPVEFSFKHNKTLFNIRYEQGLLNRLKKDLAAFEKDRYGLLTFEVGFRIK